MTLFVAQMTLKQAVVTYFVELCVYLHVFEMTPYFDKDEVKITSGRQEVHRGQTALRDPGCG
jgi:hypothetical protein